jgi:hypothetical protein
VALNVKPSLPALAFREIIRLVLKAFYGLDYTLLLGTEESMIGRINGLSRVSLLEPWLFKYKGQCLFGDSNIREKIIEPSSEMLKEKYRELLLYFSYSHLWRDTYPYALYRLLFTLDYLLKHSEVIVESSVLAGIYGKEFIPEEKFRPLEDTGKLFAALKEKHAFDLFGN